MRRGYAIGALAVLLVEVAIALWVHDHWVRPFGGDVLAVVLVYLGLRAVTRWRWPVAVAAALVVAVVVEVGQLLGLAGMLGFGRGSAGEVVLGSGFDPLDFLAYGLGAFIVSTVERRRPSSS